MRVWPSRGADLLKVMVLLENFHRDAVPSAQRGASFRILLTVRIDREGDDVP